MRDYHKPESELTEVMSYQPLTDGWQIQLQGYAGGDDRDEWRERIVVTDGDTTLTLMDEEAATFQPVSVYNAMVDSLEDGS